MDNRLNAYRETAIQTASRTKLVVMLYEGAVRFLRETVAAIESKNLERKRRSVDRAVAIVQHLQGTLDMELGHNVAADLDRLYSYITSRILEGSASLETAPLEEALKLLSVLLEGWEEAAKKEEENAGGAGFMTQTAAAGGFELHV